MEAIIYFVLWAALLQGLLLALLYIFSKKNKSFSNVLLGLFLISLIIEALSTILPFDNIGTYSIGEYFSLPVVKLFIPLLFVHFVLEKIGKSEQYKRFLKINYIIAYSIAGLTLINVYLFLFKSSSIAKEVDFATVDMVHFVLQVYAFLISVAALVISIRETLNYKNLVKTEFSDYSMLQIKWLWQLIFMLLPATVLWGVELLRILITDQGQNELVLVLWGFIAVFLYYLSFQAYRHPDFFEKFPESILDKAASTDEVHQDHYCTAENSKRIQELMYEKESFLNHDLTIHQFAKEIGMSPRLISSCVNQNLGHNFNEWVNGFRIKKVLELIESDPENKLSIEGIGHEAGFKSRSAMYAAFKKEKGRSPGHFRHK